MALWLVFLSLPVVIGLIALKHTAAAMASAAAFVLVLTIVLALTGNLGAFADMVLQILGPRCPEGGICDG